MIGGLVIDHVGDLAVWLGCFGLGAAVAIGHLATGPARERRAAAMRALVIVDDEVQVVANYLAREPDAGPQHQRAAVSAEWTRWYTANSGAAPIIDARPGTR